MAQRPYTNSRRPGKVESINGMIRIIREPKGGIKEGAKFGFWTILGPSFRIGRLWYVVCQCDCGTIAVICVQNLRRGTSKSCGPCGVHFKHRECHTRIYKLWNSMKQRCTNPSTVRYHRYGGRGIFVCDEWRNNFEQFRDWAIANGWKPGLQVDRYPNQDGPYCPENCRIADRFMQMNNMSKNVLIEAFGEIKTAAEWARDPRAKVQAQTILHRIEHGWNAEEAITTPPDWHHKLYEAFGENLPLKTWAKHPICRVSYSGLRKRVDKLGWDIERALITPPDVHGNRIRSS